MHSQSHHDFRVENQLQEDHREYHRGYLRFFMITTFGPMAFLCALSWCSWGPAWVRLCVGWIAAGLVIFSYFAFLYHRVKTC